MERKFYTRPEAAALGREYARQAYSYQPSISSGEMVQAILLQRQTLMQGVSEYTEPFFWEAMISSLKALQSPKKPC